MKCVVCECSSTEDNPVIKAPDPYGLEINEDEREVWMCGECREDSALDI